MKRRLAIAAGLVLLSSVPARPCIPVSRDNVPIAVAQEEAVIAYDSRTGTERFIRKATFATRDPDFGFLVPTPTVPALSQSSDALFARLRSLIQTPVIVKSTRFLWGPMKAEDFKSATSGTARVFSGAAQVVVQEMRQVGDYDAAILKATSTDALLEWLKKHGYVSGPELKEWLGPYVRQGYAITAFRVTGAVREKQAAGTPVHLAPVCMTFQTPAPFYPYREGANAVARQGRLLRVYYMGDKRVTGRLGNSLADAADEWGATMAQSRVLSASNKSELVDGDVTGLSPAQIGDRLTVFEDHARLRPRKDLFFAAAADQATQVPVRVEYNDIYLASLILPIGGSLFFGTMLAWYVRRRRR